MGDRLDTHLQLGRKHGLDDDALTALMTLLAVYLGYARASVAMESVHASRTRERGPVHHPLGTQLS